MKIAQRLLLIDEVCDQYESQLKSKAPPPPIESVLQQAAKSSDNKLFLDELLVELLALRLNYSFEQIDKVAAELQNRFPSKSSDIKSILQSGMIANDKDATFEADSTNPDQTVIEETPSKIGNYQLVRKIGEGGMGVVWLANQSHPVNRSVALKVIKSSISSAEFIGRFEAERQALSMMDHLSIAKVLDAGESEDGRPYFVMEMVDGSPITKYCATQRLSIEQRLRLMIKVCRAIHHAHQKGIIHRDLKPSNVLATEYEGQPIPKVIDFGLAKALEPETRLTDKSVQTQFGQIVGTVKYMAPEQADLNSLGIDTRTDIFSLGILLHELLIGTTPMEPVAAEQTELLTLLEKIRNFKATRPSLRLAQTGFDMSGFASECRTTPTQLRSVLRGDLDWILLRCLENQKSRRYESASGLADDLERYLANEPITARPPSRSYQAKKFVTRNKGLVAATGFTLLLLLGGIAGTSFGLLKASRSAEKEKQASELATKQMQVAIAEKLEADTARDNEKTSGKRTRDLFNIVMRAFETSRQDKGATVEMKAREVLVNVYEQIGDSSLDEKGRMELQLTLSGILNAHGEYAYAEKAAQEASSLSEKILGEDHELTFLARSHLAQALAELGRFEEALSIQNELLIKQTNLAGENQSEIAATKGAIGISYKRLGKLNEAQKYLEEAISLYELENVDENTRYAGFLSSLADVYRRQNKSSKAVRFSEKALKFFQDKFGEKHSKTMTARRSYGSALLRAKKLNRGIQIYESLLNDSIEIHGESHPSTLGVMNNLGAAHYFSKNLDRATELLQQAYEARKKTLGDNHPETLESAINVASMHQEGGNYERVLEILRPTVKELVEQLGEDHPTTAGARLNLAGALARLYLWEEALKHESEGLASFERKHGKQHRDTKAATNNLRSSIRSALKYYDLLVKESPEKASKLIEVIEKHAGRFEEYSDEVKERKNSRE